MLFHFNYKNNNLVRLCCAVHLRTLCAFVVKNIPLRLCNAVGFTSGQIKKKGDDQRLLLKN